MLNNPFNRSMFDSQASRSTIATFLLVLGGALLLLIILYAVKSLLRRRNALLDLDGMADRNLASVPKGFFRKVAAIVFWKRSFLRVALSRLAAFDPPSVSCSIVRTGNDPNMDEAVGQAVLFHLDGKVLLQDKSFYLTMPDGIKAEDRMLSTGEGDVLNLRFLHDRIPYTIDCQVLERVRFSAEMLRHIDPRIEAGYRLVPITGVAKQDLRQVIRFSHKVRLGALRVYPQILFDVYVQTTDFRFPARGSIPSRIDELKLIPCYDPGDMDITPIVSEQVVGDFKEMIRVNPREERVVYVRKPHMVERTNRRTLLDLGYAEVLGLAAQKASRTIYIRRPGSWPVSSKAPDDPHDLIEEDSLVLDFFSRSPLDGQNVYYEMICEVIKKGITSIVLRPRHHIREETGLPVELLDFSMNGMRFKNSKGFMRYALGVGWQALKTDQQQEILENMGLVFAFYPRLRFSGDTSIYKPDLPLKFSILGKIVRCETKKRITDYGRLAAFGMRYMYDPAGYSVDDFCWDGWVMIPPYRENRYFKEVHKSLNGLIAHLERHSRGILTLHRSSAQMPETAPSLLNQV